MVCHQLVSKIRSHVENGIFCQIEHDEDVKQLAIKYPKLFAMISRKDCDKQMLSKLLLLSSDVHNGSLSQQKGDQLFGTVAAEKYVIPLAKKPN